MLTTVRAFYVKVLVAVFAATAFSVQAQEFLPPIIDRTSGVAESMPASKQIMPVDKRSLSIDQRLQRVERLLDSQALVDMSMQLETMQSDSQAMRGELESLTHEIETIKQRQRDLYLDVDRRLRQVEVAATKPAPTTMPVEGASSMAPAMAITPVSVAGTVSKSLAAQSGMADPAQEREAYQQAFNVLKEGQYDKAIAEFQNFLANYPAGDFTGNAQYWLGEANYVTRRFDVAVTEFEKVLQQHPDSSKVSDAMLKLGYTYYELGQWQKARETLDLVVSNHPGTTVARLAGNRLQKMRLEGR